MPAGQLRETAERALASASASSGRPRRAGAGSRRGFRKKKRFARFACSFFFPSSRTHLKTQKNATPKAATEGDGGGSRRSAHA